MARKQGYIVGISKFLITVLQLTMLLSGGCRSGGLIAGKQGASCHLGLKKDAQFRNYAIVCLHGLLLVLESSKRL